MMSIFDQAAKNASDKQKSKKKSGRLKAFFKGVWSELKKVHWPSKKQLATYTGVVIVTVLVMAVAISIFDWVISSLLELILSLA
jgi:preprotein translocase subunit SecE